MQKFSHLVQGKHFKVGG